MALGAGRGATRDRVSLPPNWIQTVLAMEVSLGTAADPERFATADLADGEGESSMGSGADCE
jgi:hypothetical protein